MTTPLPNDESDDAIIGTALRWSLAVLLVLVTVGGAVAYVMQDQEVLPELRDTVIELPEVRERPAANPPEIPLRNVTAQAGIHFQHENGATGEKLLPETMGAGCAFLDYDRDGDQDILLVNSMRWPWDQRPSDKEATLKLFANDGQGRFTDVTIETGLNVSLYGMGVAVGDYDNDGDSDIFLSAVGPNRLFRNEQGRFLDVTAEAGVAGSETEWGTSCGFFDYNNDGRLDLVVGNYIRWSKEIDLSQDFRLVGVGRAYGPPTAFEGTYLYLYRNDGGGKFSDVTAEAGLQVSNPATGVPMAKTMGVAPVDLDRDGWMDLIVANDTVQNFLFHNQRDGTFHEIGALAGIAFDAAGNARGAMGIDTAHHRNDQTLAVGIGNFANEMTAFYCAAESPLQFVDAAIANGLGPATRLELTFGLFFVDVDLDGRLDLFAANGHLEEEIHRVQESQHYEQPPQLFWNCGPESRTEFVALSAEKTAADLHQPLVGRGAAYADIDADGDLDLLVTSVGGAPRLLRNDQQLEHHWLRFELSGNGTTSNRDAIGAWIEVSIGDDILRRQVMPTRSYLSQTELPVTIGIGTNTQVDEVHIVWPDGSRQAISVDGVDRLVKVEQPQNEQPPNDGVLPP